ncbi:MAG: hypothetical protein ABSH09_11785 [Bryobacteraceae bacterium]|jgi:hypothetical protein
MKSRRAEGPSQQATKGDGLSHTVLPTRFCRFTSVGDKVRVVALILIAIAPCAYLAWTWRSMPQLGFYHDDAINWVSAKSLAEGAGYRIASLPQQPFQTKYPPVFPALLALVWKINPAFPFNLPLATLAVWLAFPFYVLLVFLLLRQYGFGNIQASILTLLAALNPFAAMLSISLMPEMLFTVLLLALLILAEQALRPESRTWLVALAGALAGLAYLTKSAALPLSIAVPLCFALRKQYKRGLLFAGCMFPAIAGWQLWVLTHASRGHDLVTLYYTNYFGFQLYNVKWFDLPRVIWFNLDALLKGIGRLLVFDTAIGESVHFERVIAIGAIAGVIRLARRSGRLQYPMAAAAMTAVLLVWHYEPDQRFVFPLYPLLLAGLWTELSNIVTALRKSWEKRAVPDRIAAGIGAAILAAFGIFVAFTHVYGDFVFLPKLLAAYRSDFRDLHPVYSWVAENTPEQASLYGYDDPLIYLYTGRRASGLPIPTKLYYHEDEAGIDRLLRDLPSFSEEQHLDYVLLSTRDFYRDLHEKRARLLQKAIEQNPQFEKVYGRSDAEVFHRISRQSHLLN